jgi:hypothetical protein
MALTRNLKWILGVLILAAMLMGFLSSNVAMASDSSAARLMSNEHYSSYLSVRSYSAGQDEDTFSSSSSATGVNSLQIWSYLYINGSLKKQVWNSCYCGSLAAQGKLVIDKTLNHNKTVNGTHLFDYGGGNTVWRYSQYNAY